MVSVASRLSFVISVDILERELRRGGANLVIRLQVLLPYLKVRFMLATLFIRLVDHFDFDGLMEI